VRAELSWPGVGWGQLPGTNVLELDAPGLANPTLVGVAATPNPLLATLHADKDGFADRAAADFAPGGTTVNVPRDHVSGPADAVYQTEWLAGHDAL
jgi:hypothetical protein